MTYRPEIDGLRTIAVCAVIVYHLEMYVGTARVLKGGFLGVDVFFVISGYLITSLILNELTQTGRFRIGNFYEKRARRLLPALLAVTLVSIPIAWYLLLPTQLIDFSYSILSSLTFASNFYWYFSLQEYGAESALLKPFLHTWSLAIEEQYYIFFPLILIGIFGLWARRVPLILTIGLVLSLAAAEVITTHDQSLSFYLLPSRMWELLAGSLLAAHALGRTETVGNHAVTKLLPGAGLLLIISSLVFIGFDANHPGLITIFPVLGTVLIIRFARASDPVTKLLSSSPVVGIGLISYSLYLWHYPIFAFGRVLETSPDLLSKLIWLILTIALSIACFYLVERPARNRNALPRRRFLLILFTVLAAAVAAVTYFIQSDGRSYRSASLTEVYDKNNPDNRALRKESWKLLETARRSWDKDQGPDRKTRVLLIGNSHSKDTYNALVQTPGLMKRLEVARKNLEIGGPAELVDDIVQSPLFQGADVIVLSTKYVSIDGPDAVDPSLKQRFKLEANDLDRLGGLIDQIRKFNKKAVVLSNTVEFKSIDGMPVFDWWLTQNGQQQDLGRLYYEHIDQSRIALNKQVEKIAIEHGAQYLEKADYMCSAEQQTCDGITDDGYKIFFDYGHYTLEGAQHFGKKIESMGWLEDVL